MDGDKKICTRCKVQKLAGDFNVNRARVDGLEGHCKACFMEKRRLKRESNGGKEKSTPKPPRRLTPVIPEKLLQGPKTTPELLAAADRLRAILQEILSPIEKAVQEVKERFAL